jgi:uncharacterized damage-inducible protein DinB
MRAVDIAALLAFNYWANRQLLEAAKALPQATLRVVPTFTYRSLRGTLVHTLDVEMSWRARLRGESPAVWDRSLNEDDYPSVTDMADAWVEDEREMLTWLRTLTDEDLEAVVDLGNRDRFPLWYYMVHIVTHSEQQRRDVQLLLRSFGIEPPDLEFLYYADTIGSSKGK